MKANPYSAVLCAIGLFLFCCDRTWADDVSAIGAALTITSTGDGQLIRLV